eukprot:361752-Chlamydomonas_euryale.AAC.1
MSTYCTTGMSPASTAGQGAAGPEPANNARDFPRCVCWPEASAKRCSASVRIATAAGWQSERKAFVSSVYWPETAEYWRHFQYSGAVDCNSSHVS